MNKIKAGYLKSLVIKGQLIQAYLVRESNTNQVYDFDPLTDHFMLIGPFSNKYRVVTLDRLDRIIGIIPS